MSTAAPGIELGPFRLEARIRRGGMGEVYRGVHREQGVPVAIKLLTTRRALDPDFQQAFADEVRAVARLDHPGVVLVFDHGRVDATAASRSDGRLVQGSPYLVMELASDGALTDLRARLDWPAIRELLLAMLDALAHAHARGVIHRDLKPGNILRCASYDPRPGWKLADFGIAYALVRQERGQGRERPTGTPYYMAPEQFRAAWRDYGPWTDLYALGCLAWELVTGMPPFGRTGPQSLKRAHLYQEPPPLAPLVPVPDGLEAWLLAMLQKEPCQRYAWAADAAYALRALGEAAPGPVSAMTLTPTSHTLNLDDLGTDSPSEELTVTDVVDTAETRLIAGDELEDAPTETAARPPRGSAVELPFPSQWADRGVEALPIRLLGAGLGVYGLRTVPMVGRESERDALWAALGEVTAVGRPAAVILRGAAGVGKSRLAAWLGERAHELGVAHLLKAAHSPVGGPTDGLSRMVAASLRCVGLSRNELLVRAVSTLRAEGATDSALWKGLVELMRPGLELDDDAGTRFGSPAERYALLCRWVRHLAGDVLGRRTPRSVVMWLDDVQWGSDALAFAEYVLRRSEDDLPLLLVLTAREESLPERPDEATQLESVAALPRVRALPVPPLDPAARVVLVRHLLGLSGELAARVEERTAGNPLFAIHLVGDWVQRGVLEPATTGFELRPGEEAVLPGDLHQVWRDRLQQLLRDEPPEAVAALELAAALGQDVDGQEWRRACVAAGLGPLPEATLDRLARARLVLPQEQGWSFAHGMLRECLELQARASGRWVAHHRACAKMLAQAPDLRGRAERLGRHLLAAGADHAAVAPLLEGARERGEVSEYRQAHALLSLREEALERLERPAADTRRGEGTILRYWLFTRQGRLQEAREQAQRALADATRHGWDRIAAEATEGLGYVSRHTGRLPQSVELYSRARTRYEACGLPVGVARCDLALGGLARQLGRVDEARVLHEQALEVFREHGDLRGIGLAIDGLGVVARTRGDLDEAEACHREALALFEQMGDLVARAEASRGLAETFRAGARVDEAEVWNGRALKLLDDAEVAWADLYRAYVGLAHLQRGRFEEADRVLAEASEAMERFEAVHYLGGLCVVRLLCKALANDWQAWDPLLERGASLLRSSGLIERDVAMAAEAAGQLALHAGERRRAARVLAVARDQWEGLGETDRAAQVRALLAPMARPPGGQ